MDKLIKHKLQLYLLKTIPVILGILCFSCTLFQYIKVNTIFINYIMYFVLYIFIYIASFMFKFCNYHRIFIHYVLGTNIISLYDAYIGIPVDNYEIFAIYMLLTGLCIFLISKQYVQHQHNKRTRNNSQRNEIRELKYI